MTHKSYSFSHSKVDYYFAGGFSHLKSICDPKQTVIITDENIFRIYEKKFKKWNCIVLKAGEDFKVQATVDTVIDQLIEMGADRKTMLVGIGGGVITDITGYIASVYMRGIRFGFLPTTLLAMVDASIGGKNGIDVGIYKNMVGTIRQPAFILHDMLFLNSLPQSEWENGFAEIIKHAAIKDLTMFKELEVSSPAKYKSKKTAICDLVKRNVILKTRVVISDEYESGDRKLLNFGHTLGHALENQYELSHGQAISIGMTYAAGISEQLLGFKEKERLVALLEKYNLPTYAEFDKKKAFEVLKKDKKKADGQMSYILLSRIGKGVTKSIPLGELAGIIESL
ncbi:MAG: 3-dehydroquinate synthase [Gemmatimonadaceae bacterium]|nr:3-dehydroquinate synthase [Chitinophagaceae bacterium]